MKEGIEHFFATSIEQCLGKHDMQPPLVAVDPAAFAISDRDMALLLKQLPLRPDDADRGTEV